MPAVFAVAAGPKTKSGYIQQSPLVGIISATVDQVNKLCREFGLTPAARTRIQVPEESSYDRQNGSKRRSVPGYRRISALRQETV